jgi:hypothetical protein
MPWKWPFSIWVAVAAILGVVPLQAGEKAATC